MEAGLRLLARQVAYREILALRGKLDWDGITVRSPIDVLLASFCIENDHALLHANRDFDALESLRGLKVWRH